MAQHDDETATASTSIGDTLLPRQPSELVTVDPERYADRKTLTHGGMGRILTAYDRRLARTVAIKELLEQDDSLRARFEREVQLTAGLEHPSIVTVHEAGRWPSGEPFYAMRLVPGRSFDKVIADATDLPARLALLPHVIAVADALAYAHGRRVIHRDLKPSNVMIGEFGETVVIDWGLAKRLDGTRRSASDLSRPTNDESTEAGVVLGTPAYMPLEQALGEVIDERADVYAIGAILYHLIAGRAPYQGANAHVLALLCAEPPLALETLEPSAPPDLLAVVRRAITREAEQRYPSARELADDLRKFQAGQLVGAHRYTARELVRRWVARHRTPIAVGGIAVVALLAFGGYSIARIVRAEHAAEQQSVVADQQRAAAEDQRREVESLLSFMVNDEFSRLEKIGHLDVLRPIAGRAASYYAAHSTIHDDAERQHRIEALADLGAVMLDQGDSGQALDQFRAALALAGPPSLAVVGAHLGLGDVHRARGDSDAAFTEYRAALATFDQLADAASAGSRQRLGKVHDRLGNMYLRRGDSASALAEFEAELALETTIAAADPEARREVALVHQRLAHVQLVRDRPDDALAEYRQMLDWLQPGPGQTEDPHHLRDMASAHDNIGDVLFDKEDRGGALVEYRAALALDERATTLDPTDQGLQLELAAAHGRVGDAAKYVTGSQAVTEERAALAIEQRVAERDPDNADARQAIALTREALAKALQVVHDDRAAVVELRTALAAWEELRAKDPHDVRAQRETYTTRLALADGLARLGQRKAALEEANRALTEATALSATEPTDADFQHDVTMTRELIERITPH